MTRSSRRHPAGNSEGVYIAAPGVIYAAILFCLIFACVGAFTFVPSLVPWFWKALPCEVLRFEIEDHAKAKLPFSAQVLYRFEWQGTTHESTRVGIAGWKDAATPLTLAKRFSENRKTQCYLPDGFPENAVLFRPPPKWEGLFFVGFGVCMGWLLIQAHRSRDQPKRETAQRILPAVAVFFGTPGLAMTLGMSLPVWVESLEVRHWKKTPATVIWSEVRATRGDKSTNYRADICYEYQAAGKTWRNNRVRPGAASGSDNSSADGLASSYPAGLQTHCYVHPTRPERVVLLASPGWAVLLTLFPLPFLAVGMICVREAIRSRKPPREPDLRL